jgi:MYXO-CTERM domain-containing protein
MVFALLAVSATTGGAAARESSVSHLAAASAELTWSSEQAIAALTAAPVASLPGSPAVIDEQRLTEAIGTSSIKILAVPFAQPEKPTDSRMDEATSDELQTVRSWALDKDIDLITVVGLHIDLGGILEQRPDSVPDLQRTMLRSDLTPSLLFSIAYEQSGRDAADQVSKATETKAVEIAVPADPAATETIAAALEQDKYYAAPGVDAPEGAFEDWQELGPDRVVRVALLAAPAPGEPLVDQLGPLSARFPNDIVVVASGRWVQMAGPEQKLLDSAVLYGYGAFYGRIAQNDMPLANLVLGMLRRVGELRGGTVSDQAGPATDDPVSGVTPLLPWLFAGTAVLVLAALLLVRRRRSTSEVVAARTERRERARTMAQLAPISEQLLQLDGLARHGRSRELVTSAAERYEVARDLLLQGGDLDVARAALGEASELVADAATELQVPLAGSGDGRQPIDTDRPAGAERR